MWTLYILVCFLFKMWLIANQSYRYMETLLSFSFLKIEAVVGIIHCLLEEEKKHVKCRQTFIYTQCNFVNKLWAAFWPACYYFTMALDQQGTPIVQGGGQQQTSTPQGDSGKRAGTPGFTPIANIGSAVRVRGAWHLFRVCVRHQRALSSSDPPCLLADWVWWRQTRQVVVIGSVFYIKWLVAFESRCQ